MGGIKKVNSSIFRILTQVEINWLTFVGGTILAVFLVILNFLLISLLFPIANLILSHDLAAALNIKYIGPVILYLGIQQSFWKILVLMGSFLYMTILLKALIRYFSFLFINLQAREAAYRIRQIVFKRYLKFGKQFYDNRSVADLNRTLIESSDVVYQGIDNINKIVIDVITLFIFGLYLFKISWQLALLSVIPLVFLYYTSGSIKNRIRKLLTEREHGQRTFLIVVNDILSCIPLVKSFGKEKYEETEFSRESEKDIESSVKIYKKMQLLSPLEEIVSTTTILFIAAMIAIATAYDKEFNLASAMVFMYILHKMPEYIGAIQAKKTALIQLEPRIRSVEDVLVDKDKYIVEGGENEFTGLAEQIEVKNLTFGYEAKDVLKNISFVIPKGKTTAIVGKTGSGKSTIAHLLLRFYDCPEGSILFDGKDIKSYSLDSIKKHIVFVSQQTMLFNKTIRENIVYGHPEAEPEKLVNIIKSTDLQSVIEKFTERDQYIVGERGAKLSGGERQRVSLARSLLKNASIVILDEPTSSLDAKTEKDILATMKSEWLDKTVVIIAHRISTVMHADEVLVMENGAIVERGSPQDLLERKGKFFEYYNA